MVGPPHAVAAVRVAVRACLQELPQGALALVGCSGGGDSLPLAAALAFEAPRAGVRAGGVTVDHGLQQGSAARARAVASWMCGLGLDPVECIHVNVLAAGGPEAAAREARRSALESAASRLGSSAILLGHTRDDQAETVLLGLARGSGARSLGGMAPASAPYHRPLLDLPRSTVRSAAATLPVWDDPHNEDLSYRRVRVRLAVLPVLERELGPGIATALARTGELLRADADALDSWAASAWADCCRVAATGCEVDVASLASLPPAIRRRVLRRAVLAAGSPATDLTLGHVAAVERLVTHYTGQRGVDLPGRVRVIRERGQLIVGAVPSG